MDERPGDILAPQLTPIFAVSVEFRVLGPLELIDADGTVALGHGVALGSAHQRLLLALLLLRVPEAISLDLLIDELLR